jgi:hypothetical protein
MSSTSKIFFLYQINGLSGAHTPVVMGVSVTPIRIYACVCECVCVCVCVRVCVWVGVGAGHRQRRRAMQKHQKFSF